MTIVDTIVVPAASKLRDSQSLFTNWLQHESQIRGLEFNEAPMDLRSYIPVLQERNGKQQKPIDSLGFVNVQLTRKNLEEIVALVDNQITKLTFENCIPSDLVCTFVEFLHRDVFNSIKHLKIEKCLGLDPRVLELSGLKVLSLIDCGLDIASVLEIISLKPTQNLTSIDLSGNIGRSLIKSDFSLPMSIVKFCFDRVGWSGNNFRLCWSAILHQNSEQMTASFGTTQMIPDQWEGFFAGCEKLASASLNTLIWIRNPIDDRFFRCLANCWRLTALNLSGAIRPGDPALPGFTEFIRTTKSLAELAISACDRATILPVDDLKMIFGSIAINRSIERITALDHRAGSQFFLFVSEILMINRKVAGIRLDGNNFTDLKVFFKVFERWQIRGRALYFPWPESDLATICAEDSNAVPHLQKLRALWEVVIAGNQNVEAPKESYEFASESIPEVTESEGATGIGQSARLKTRKGAIVFEEKDSIDPPDASESLLPLPPLPPIDNEAVVKQFDMEFPLESLIEQFNCA